MMKQSYVAHLDADARIIPTMDITTNSKLNKNKKNSTVFVNFF